MSTLTELQQLHVRVMSDLQFLFGQLELSETRHRLIRELDAAILRSTFSPQQVFDLIVAKCLKHTGASHGQIVIHRQGKLIVVASSEPDRVGDELGLQDSLCGKAVSERSEQHFSDITMLPPDSYVRYHDTTKSELVVLIQPANEARVLGVIDLERDEASPFPIEGLHFARLLAGQAAIAIEHAHIASNVKTLYEINNAIVFGTLTLQQSCQEILDALLANSDFEHGQILVRDGDQLVILASSRKTDIGLRPGPDSSVCGRYLLAENGRAIMIIDDIHASSYADVYLNLLGDEGASMRSEMIVPLADDANVLIGALNIESPNRGVFTAFDETYFGVVGRFLAHAISMARVRQKRAQAEQVGTAVLAMTQLGSAASSFLHRFGSAIGNVENRLGELRDLLATHELPPARPEVSVERFIGGMIGNLVEAGQVIQEFRNRFNPHGAEFQFHVTDLAPVAQNAIREYKDKHRSSGVEFRFVDKLPVARVGQTVVHSKANCRLTDKVTEVIENLLDNAFRAVVEKSSGTTGGLITLSISLSDVLTAKLRITDNGIGISEKDKPLIFTFGYTTRAKKGASHGIGLWFCQLYALQVGGKLTFDSNEGQGSWFELEFPTSEV